MAILIFYAHLVPLHAWAIALIDWIICGFYIIAKLSTHYGDFEFGSVVFSRVVGTVSVRGPFFPFEVCLGGYHASMVLRTSGGDCDMSFGVPPFRQWSCLSVVHAAVPCEAAMIRRV